MVSDLIKEMYFTKLEELFTKGLKNGKIVPFSEEFYKQMDNTYFGGIPVSLNIKYLRPTRPPMKCYDRSLEMFFCFDNAILVRADRKDLELAEGKEYAGHGWIEIDNYVYDPTSLCKFDKKLYYKMYKPTNIMKCTKKEYLKNNKEFYEVVKSITIEDYKLGGSKRFELILIMPFLREIAELPNNEEFKIALNNYLTAIEYDEKQIGEDLAQTVEKNIQEEMKRVRTII